MRSKLVRFGIILIGLIGFAFLLGVRQGKRDENRKALKFSIASEVHLYRIAEKGDSAKLKNDLGMLIYGHTREFEKNYTGEPVSETLKERIEAAREISADVKTNLVVIDSRLFIEEMNAERRKMN